MPESTWPDFVTTACENTWMDDYSNLLGEDFEKCWGGFTYEILSRVLSEETGEERVFDERVFALFLVAYVAPWHAKDLLRQFVHADNVKERWAATIGLGRLHDPQAFPLLQDILLTWLLELQRYETALLEGVDAPWLSEMGNLMDWCGDRCHIILLLLGNWKDPQAIPTLHQALQICWTNDQRLTQLEDHDPLYSELSRWHQLEDYLAYTAGMLGAWEILLHLGLSDIHFRIAVIYQALGALHIPPEHVFDPLGLPRFKGIDTSVAVSLGLEPAPPKLREHSGLSQEEYTESITQFIQAFQVLDERNRPYLRPEPVAHILQERFGLSPEEAMEYIVGLRQACNDRTGSGHLWADLEIEDQPF
ncbi:MAG: HEAT repeat domain-containing protein [Chloroflexota bacterium]|nr:HEAT repeat domain-containing protein [Chloroflexota bacterium]